MAKRLHADTLLCRIIFTHWFIQKNKEDTINQIISGTKKFMAYEIVKRLKKIERIDLMKIMHDAVNPNDAIKGKIHNVFQPSSDNKRVLTEKINRQKLNYMHKNPVSGKWRLVEHYLDYVSACVRQAFKREVL